MNPIVSKNFAVAKVLAIMTVVASHWFRSIDLWILATVALFLFGFSSSFFTGRRYGVAVDVRAFWKTKLRRLGVRYWLILALLALLLLAQGRVVFHWHSLVHLAGLSGLLNLYGPSASSLGRGLWFFTLLLFFYALYPLLARFLLASSRTTLVLGLVTVGLVTLHQTVDPGFALWLTMLGFIFGVYAGVNRLRVKAIVADTALITIPFLLAAANFLFELRELNGPLLFAFSLALSLRLTLPGAPLRPLYFLVPLEACLLEIYLIHSYLFIRPTGHSLADFALSLVLIVAAALVLNTAGNRLVARIFDGAPARRPAAAPLEAGAQGEPAAPLDPVTRTIAPG